MTEKQFIAHVLWWNSKEVQVRCPLCSETHQHRFRGYDNITGVAACPPEQLQLWNTDRYRIVFPLDGQSPRPGYEIDKASARFVAVHQRQENPAPPAHEMDVHSGGLGSRQLSDGPVDSTPAAPPPQFDPSDLYIDHGTYKEHATHRDIALAFEQCIAGNIAYVKRYLAESKDAPIFLHGINVDGNTTLLLAAVEPNPGMINLLLSHGAPANTANVQGRTALMEAALWGRVDNVAALLRGGADRESRDVEGLQARDLVRQNNRNQRERWLRTIMAGRDEIFPSQTHRDGIMTLLADEPLISRTATPDPPRNNVELASLGTPSPFISPPADGPIAVLVRGGHFDPVAAVKITGPGGAETISINGDIWTTDVLRLSRLARHNLKRLPARDRGHEGSYHASHGVKQLVAWYVDRHVFLPEESGEKVSEKSEVTEESWELRELSLARPLAAVGKVEVRVGGSVCGDCVTWVEKVNETLQMNVNVRGDCDVL